MCLINDWVEVFLLIIFLKFYGVIVFLDFWVIYVKWLLLCVNGLI